MRVTYFTLIVTKLFFINIHQINIYFVYPLKLFVALLFIKNKLFLNIKNDKIRNKFRPRFISTLGAVEILD